MKKLNNFNKISFIILFLASYAGTIYSNAQSFFKEPLTEYHKENWRKKGTCNNSIRFFKDANGNKFVMKDQYSSLTAIHDTLGAKIGSSTNVPVNQVELLPVGSMFMGKKIENIATFHTHAPGIEVDKVKNFESIDIVAGLSDHTLKSISQHKGLRSIVALNIYLNNKDSHNHNLFYDEETDNFCAIDQGDIFGAAFGISDRWDKNTSLGHICRFTTLANKSCQYIETLEEKNIPKADLKALIDVKIKLEQLIDQYPSEKIYAEWMHLADKAQYACSPQKKESLKIMFDYGVAENKHLCSKLDDLIKINAIPYSLRRMAEPSKKAQHDFWHTINS